MEIIKEAGTLEENEVSREDLALINALAQKELKPEEVYTFSVRLCDNEVDREWERFPRETLEKLAGLFVGKSGIFDHNWSAAGQAARIYKTEVVEEEGLTAAGDKACYLKGWAYMLRTGGNAELIAQIQGGIKKEVSVGCSVEKAVCSVCGEALGQCRHVKGRTYNGKLCWGELVGAKDAYEWSFVAVPAQRKAGVMKGFSLKELCGESPVLRAELAELEKAAGVGRRYLEELRGKVKRLAGLKWSGMDMGTVRSIVDKLDGEELKALEEVFSGGEREGWTGKAQLSYPGREREKAPEDGAFLV